MSFREFRDFDTYSYKKVHHKKYIECKIDLLCYIVAPFLTTFHFFIRCIDKVNDERCDTENKDENHLRERAEREMKMKINYKKF
jgi:hypothetical protein